MNTKMLRKLIEPGMFFCLWMAAIYGAACLYFPDEVAFGPAFFILMCVTAACFGNALTRFLPVPNVSSRAPWMPEKKILWILFWIASTSWILECGMSLYPLLHNISLANPSLTKKLITEAFIHRESTVLTSGAALYGGTALALNIIGCPSLFLGGTLFAKGRWAGLLPLVAAGAKSLVLVSRFHLFIYLLLFFYSYVSVKTDLFSKKRILDRRVWIAVGASVFIFGSISYFRLVPTAGLGDVILTYMAGPLAAFNHWFSRIEWFTTGDFAGRTLHSGVSWFAKLGHGSSPPPLHLEYTMIGQSYTNAYSGLRLLVEDFGMAWTPVFYAAFGFIAGAAARKCILGRSYACVPIMAFLWTYAFYSIYTSITVDTRIVIGCLFSAVLFHFAVFRAAKKEHQDKPG